MPVSGAPFLSSEVKCPRGQICCKNTLPFESIQAESTCEESGHQCLDFDLCDPNSFDQKPSSNIDTADLIFGDSNLKETNSGGGLTINNAKNLCDSPTQICCKPKLPAPIAPPLVRPPLSPQVDLRPIIKTTTATTTTTTQTTNKAFDYASTLAIIQDFLGEENFEEEDFS